MNQFLRIDATSIPSLAAADIRFLEVFAGLSNLTPLLPLLDRLDIVADGERLNFEVEANPSCITKSATWWAR